MRITSPSGTCYCETRRARSHSKCVPTTSLACHRRDSVSNVNATRRLWPRRKRYKTGFFYVFKFYVLDTTDTVDLSRQRGTLTQSEPEHIASRPIPLVCHATWRNIKVLIVLLSVLSRMFIYFLKAASYYKNHAWASRQPCHHHHTKVPPNQRECKYHCKYQQFL